MAKERRDNRNRLLERGEYQDPKTLRYEFNYTDLDGYKRKVYSWCLKDTDRPPQGRKCEKSLRRMEREIRRGLEDGLDMAKAKCATVDDYFEKMLAINRKRKETTKATYRQFYRIHIKPSIGSKVIARLKYSDIVNLYLSLCESLQSSTVKIAHTILHPLFDLAVRDNVILKNPSDGAMKNLETETQNKKPSLTIAEQQIFLRAIKKYYPHYYNLFVVLLGTGCRIGEIIGLTWDDCDFQKGIVSINKTFVRYHSDAEHCMKIAIQTPKSKEGVRIIPMFRDVKKALLDERKRPMVEGFNPRIIDGYSGFVFQSSTNNMVWANTTNYIMQRIVERYNEDETADAKAENREPVLLPHISNHILRHTFITRLCENTSDIQVIQAVAGHADIKITMKVYADVTQERKADTFAGIDEKMALSI